MASPGPPGLSAYSALPSQHSILNHVIRPPVALSVESAPSVVPGFATHEQARRVIPPKQVRHPTDCRFTSGCSPPHVTVTQLPSISGLRPTQARTCTTLTKRPHGRTHDAGNRRRDVLLAPGQVTAYPVATRMGFFIIRVDGRRSSSLSDLEPGYSSGVLVRIAAPIRSFPRTFPYGQLSPLRPPDQLSAAAIGG
jgi:hypothetical protein